MRKIIIIFLVLSLIPIISSISWNTNLVHTYGEMWAHNDTLSFTVLIPVQDQWVNITINETNAEAGQSLNGFTFNKNTSSLSPQFVGVYKVDYSISAGNAGNNQEYQYSISINDVRQENTDSHRKIGAAGDVGNDGASGFVVLAVGDRVNLQTKNNDGTGNLLVHAVNVNLIRISD